MLVSVYSKGRCKKHPQGGGTLSLGGGATNFWKNFKKQNGRQIAKLCITRSFFELQSPNFAWKFVWKMSSCRQAVIKLLSSCHQAVVKYKNTKIWKYEIPKITLGRQLLVLHTSHLLAGAKHAALYVGWSQARDGAVPNTKLCITHSFFELQSPDFAWKFVWKMSSCH